MAVVLNDLLGISNSNRVRGDEERIERFPSYEEFLASRNDTGSVRRDDNAYDCENDERRYGNFRGAADYRSEANYADDGYGYDDRLQSRESEGEIYNGSKRVSSPTSVNFRGVQANADRDYNACLYSVRDEMSSVSDSHYEDSLYDRLAYISPLANSHQMRTTARRIAAEPIARKPKQASRLTFKGKVILAVYIALAILITTLIAVNAAGLNGKGLNANGEGNTISLAETATEVETQATSTSAEVSQNSAAHYASYDYGYAESTNWFDRFCDGLSKVFD